MGSKMLLTISDDSRVLHVESFEKAFVSTDEGAGHIGDISATEAASLIAAMLATYAMDELGVKIGAGEEPPDLVTHGNVSAVAATIAMNAACIMLDTHYRKLVDGGKTDAAARLAGILDRLIEAGEEAGFIGLDVSVLNHEQYVKKMSDELMKMIDEHDGQRK